jgi:UDP-2,3-diacylglucosamine pyrophosphatase LpxH
MKFAIISDTHFGDAKCTLIGCDANGKPVQGSMYGQFKAAVGQDNDYLVLAGDVFDFSITSYENAYRNGRAFFELIQNDKIAKEIIYLAGNHDADMWHIIQHQRSVINRLQNGKLPEEYDHSVAGIIDDRTTSPTKGFWLDGVTVRTDGGPKYGSMFLDNITGANTPTNFNFAYPNLYIATDREMVLVTHGQYLEPYWSLLSEMAMKIAYDDLKIGEMDVEEMVELNYPLSQLACTGLGQAGVLTPVVYQIEIDSKNHDMTRITRYMDRLEKVIDDLTDYGWLKEIVVDFLLKKAKNEILNTISNAKETRYDASWYYQKNAQTRFHVFLAASLLEIATINANFKPDNVNNLNLPAPWRVIMGHTHWPIGWNAPDAPSLGTVSSAAPKPLSVHNTGGWLMEGNKFCGAEVFTYQTATGFKSVPIA